MRRFRPSRIALLAIAFSLVSLSAYAVDYAAYHTLAEVEQSMQQAAASPLVKLLTVGESAAGRPIRVLRISGAPAPDTAQAIFVGANAAGWHNAGTEAALDLVTSLLVNGGHPALKRTTFYVAPVLNPDAHDALFDRARRSRSGNSQEIDRDVDGLLGEDGFDDLDGDGRITWMRVADPNGDWLAHPDEPRVMIKADALKGRAGAYRLEREGRDDDGDGRFNEDPSDGVSVDMNFPKAFPYPKPEAGPWPTYAPETHAVIRFFLGRPNIALAVIYGPANNFLESPRPIESGADVGSLKFKLPKFAAEMMGFDPEEEFTIDEVWAVAKDLPIVVQNNLSKDDVAQFLGAGPAVKLEDADVKLLEHLGKDYKERLKKASLDAERPAEQYGKGGITPWLYYHRGLLAIELDIWGIPKGRKEEKSGEAKDAPLTVEGLDAMSNDEFLALKDEVIAAFLTEIKAPPQVTAAGEKERVRTGEATPKAMAEMIRQMGTTPASPASDEDEAATKRTREVLAWIDANAPEAWAPWKAVTLADGTKAEVGGVDPSIAVAPPLPLLAPAMGVHTSFVIDLASKLARLEIASLETTDLGSGIHRVRAVVANRGVLPTHAQMATRTKSLMPVRMKLMTGDGVELATGTDAVTAERLDGMTGTLEGEWLVRAPRGANIAVEASAPHVGSVRRSIQVGKGN